MGELVWSNVGEPPLSGAYYERSHELLFGPSRANGPIDQAYFAATLGDIYDGMPTPPFMYVFGLDGHQRFASYVKSMSGSFSPRASRGGARRSCVSAELGIPEGWGLHTYE
ncbi:hypothetical protein [Nannocystis pusilla]|uniref:hypothetical protein n=1 Tax=Nannocystis pusilla TaxID=889268 RepID=UPI003B80E927